MGSVRRPRSLAALACALVLGLWPWEVAAEGIEPERSEGVVEAPVPVGFTLDLASAERVQIRALILSVAQRYAVDGDLLVRIAECESQLNPRVTGPDGASGLFQVMPATWAWATERTGLVGASPYDPVASAEVAAWLLANLGPRQWGCP